MGDYWLAYLLIGIIGLILLFCFLKMHEFLKQINEKMNTIVAEVRDTNKVLRDSTDKIINELVSANRTLNDIKKK